MDIFCKSSALIIVDVHNDFYPGDALTVPDGDHVIPVLNQWVEAAETAQAVIYTTHNRHPKEHTSFKKRNGPWPPHCVENTPWVERHGKLQLPIDATINKGFDPHHDRYSCSGHTNLDLWLKVAGGQIHTWVTFLRWNSTHLTALVHQLGCFVLYPQGKTGTRGLRGAFNTVQVRR